jgi:hypothetical protein
MNMRSNIKDLKSRLNYYEDLEKKVEEKKDLIDRLQVETEKMKRRYVAKK